MTPWRGVRRAVTPGRPPWRCSTSAARGPRGSDALYRNEIGVDARADTLASLTQHCEAAGLEVPAWYGIRVASDDVPVDEPAPEGAELAALLDVEQRLGMTDPYRALGTLLHVIGRRTP